MKKPEVTVEIPEYLQAAVNTVVEYYSDGWRAGHLEGFTKMGAAIIRPIGAIGGLKPHTVNVEQDNVQLIAGDTATGSLVIRHDFEQGVPEPEKPKRKKREKTESKIIENVAAEIVKRSGENLVEIAASVVKKSERKSIFDSLKKG